MMGEVYDKYKENFGYFIIYFILSIAFELVLAYFDFFNITGSNIGVISDIKNILKLEIIALFVGLGLIELFINTYGLTIGKKVVNEDNMKEKDFARIFYYYPRLLIVGVFFTIIIIAALLIYVFLIVLKLVSLGSVLFFLFLGLIAAVVISVLTTPIMRYLVFNDEEVIPSIKEGIKLGKKYFSKILGINLIAALIGALSNIPIAKESLIVLGIVKLFTYMFMMYVNLYIMNLCKLEESGSL